MTRSLGPVLLLALAGCGDQCERLCASVSQRLNQCKPPTLTWYDLGARDRAHFVSQCQRQWDRERIDLSASDLRLSLDACHDTRLDLDPTTLSCAEILALYGPEQ